MPILGNKTLKKVYLLSTKNAVEADKAYVEINTSINIDDIKDIQTYKEDELAQTAYILAQLIVSWNMTDANGTLAPITIENVRKLPLTDFTQLGEEIKGAVEAQSAGVSTTLKEI